jgi:hypothetical protein
MSDLGFQRWNTYSERFALGSFMMAMSMSAGVSSSGSCRCRRRETADRFNCLASEYVHGVVIQLGAEYIESLKL